MSSSVPPRHVPFNVLSILATRLVALPIFRRVQGSSPEEEVWRRFCPPLNVLSPAPPWSELSVFLTERLAVARTHAQTLTHAEQTAITPKLIALTAAVRALSCAQCAGAGGHRCNGLDELQDDHQVDRRGLCLTVIHTMHRHVTRIIQAALTAWLGAGGPAQTLLPHRWVTEWTGPASHRGATPQWKTGASTTFLDDAAGPMAEIALQFAVEELDWDSLLAVVWLFNHEILCHAQQVPARGLPRQACRVFCPFFEGWMDELAHRLLEADLIAGWLGVQADAFINTHRDEIVQAAHDYYRDRYASGPGGTPRVEVTQWALGVEAARTARQFLETVAPLKSVAARRRVSLIQLFALSFRVQGLTTAPSDLDEIVEAIFDASSEQLSQSKARPRARLLNLLTAPIANKDRWIKDLQSLA